MLCRVKPDRHIDRKQDCCVFLSRCSRQRERLNAMGLSYLCVCLSVSLPVANMQKRHLLKKNSKTKQFRAMASLDNL